MSNLPINNCWIDPDGNVHRVDFHGHGKFANQVLGTNLNSELAIFELARKGWIHVGTSDFLSYRGVREITDAQYKALLVLMDSVTSGLIAENIASYVYA